MRMCSLNSNAISKPGEAGGEVHSQLRETTAVLLEYNPAPLSEVFQVQLHNFLGKKKVEFYIYKV